jgi:hypothetical protein
MWSRVKTQKCDEQRKKRGEHEKEGTEYLLHQKSADSLRRGHAALAPLPASTLPSLRDFCDHFYFCDQK